MNKQRAKAEQGSVVKCKAKAALKTRRRQNKRQGRWSHRCEKLFGKLRKNYDFTLSYVSPWLLFILVNTLVYCYSLAVTYLR